MGPPPRAVQDLPVGGTVKAAFSSVVSQPAALIRAALVPMVMFYLLYGLQLAVGDNIAGTVVVDLLQLFPHTLFAVAWHRVVLLGPAAMPVPMVPVWQKQHWRFLGYTLIFMAIGYGFELLYGPLIAPLMTQGSEVGLLPLLMITLLLASYVSLRLSFVFPAAAVDERYGFADSWRHTKGQGLRLMVAMFLVLILAILGLILIILGLSMILDFLLTIVFTIFGASERPAAGPVAMAIVLPLGYVIFALSVSVISIAFRTCTGWVPDLPGPAPVPLPGGPPDDGEDS